MPNKGFGAFILKAGNMCIWRMDGSRVIRQRKVKRLLDLNYGGGKRTKRDWARVRFIAGVFELVYV